MARPETVTVYVGHPRGFPVLADLARALPYGVLPCLFVRLSVP